jgi:DNA modification methylase
MKTVNDLIFDDKNFNKGTAHGKELMQKSLSKWGAGRSILIDKNNRIIAGNKTTENFAELGLEKVTIIDTDRDTLIAVRRNDIDLDTPEGREFALADNQTAKVNIDFDFGTLEAELDEGVLEEWGVEIPEDEVLEAEEDDFDTTPPEIPITVLGDLYEIGEHRLLCGDSTCSDTVAKLINNNKFSIYTDPPYGINLDGDNSKRGSSTSLMKGGLNLKSFKDDSTSYAVDAFNLTRAFTPLKEVWWGANYYCHSLPESNNWLVWDKRVEEKMRNTNSDCELAYVIDGHSSVRIFRHLWNGLIKASEKGSKRVHPTQKPVALASYCFNDYDMGDVILDLFGGSGSTMVACHETKRKCLMMEFSEHYVDVIVNRMHNLDPSIKIKRNGEPFTPPQQ